MTEIEKKSVMEMMNYHGNVLRGSFKIKKDSIFYDIVLKGRRSKDQNQILEQN